MAHPQPSSPLLDLLEVGSLAFADVFGRWSNQWTQYELLRLTEAYLGARLFHSSQIQGFSTRRLRDPAPKVFLALGAFNVAHARSVGAPEANIDPTPDFGLPPTLPETKRALWDLREPLIDAAGLVMGPEGLFSAFSGLRALPQLQVRQIPTDLEEAATRALGAYLRVRLPALGIDWLQELPVLQSKATCIRDLLFNQPVAGRRIVKDLEAIALIAETTEEALWAIIEAVVPT